MRLLAWHSEYTRVSKGPTAYTGTLYFEDPYTHRPVSLTKTMVQAICAEPFETALVIAYKAQTDDGRTIVSYEILGDTRGLNLSQVNQRRQQVCDEIERFLGTYRVVLTEIILASKSRI